MPKRPSNQKSGGRSVVSDYSSQGKMARGGPYANPGVNKGGVQPNNTPKDNGSFLGKNPPDISGTRSRAYNTRLPEDQVYDSKGKKIPKSSSTSRQYALNRGNQQGLAVPRNIVSYDKGVWSSTKGPFGTAKTEDSKITPLQKAAKAKRLRSKGG